jgi:hypothetical protein
MAQFTITADRGMIGHHFNGASHHFRILGTNLDQVKEAVLADTNGTVTWNPKTVSSSAFDKVSATEIRFKSKPIFSHTHGGDGTLTITLNPIDGSGNTPQSADTPSLYE